MIPHDQQSRMDQLRNVCNKTTRNYEDCLDTLVYKVKQWHHDRNLIEGSTDKDQFAKLIQEAGELSDSICKGRDVSDDIGDMLVVLINIAERKKYFPVAYTFSVFVGLPALYLAGMSAFSD